MEFSVENFAAIGVIFTVFIMSVFAAATLLILEDVVKGTVDWLRNRKSHKKRRLDDLEQRVSALEKDLRGDAE